VTDTEATIADAKRVLRQQMRERLAVVEPSQWHTAGIDVAAHFASLWPATGMIALFASRAAEISTSALDDAARARGLGRAAPRVVGDALEFVQVDDDVSLSALPKGRWGIPTPTDGPAVPLAACALVVVPGLAFDTSGGRLGYGRGFYDRALVDVDDSVIVGILHECQWVDAVPQDPWDRRLPRLVSPSGLVVAGPRG
jgi:5-formyltetrahydrofolate cyclo-ligase